MATVFTGAVVAKVQGVHFIHLRMESIMQGPEIQCVVKTFDDLVEDQNVRKIVIDFQSVDYFSSQLLSILVRLNRKLCEVGGKLVLQGLHPRLWELFRITGIDKFFLSAPTQQLALMYMQNEEDNHEDHEDH